jgi:hypothetical protein
MDCSFGRSAECLRRVRIRQPHKMPANAANSRVQLYCYGPHRLGPSFGKRLPTERELTWQDASIPQEYRINLHGCRLPGGLSNRFPPGSDVFGIEPEVAPREFLGLGFPSGRGAFAAVPGRLIPIARGCLAGPILPSLVARRSAKCFSTSIFLIRLIATPAVQLISTAAFRAAADIRSY